MGLDRGDQLIRRRVGQKVEFLAESMNGVPEPGDAALQAYLDGHRERFASPVRVTFRQVYLGTAAAADTVRLLAQLNKRVDSDAAADMGRQTQLDARMDSAPPGDIARTFGQRFAQSLAAMPAGPWTGPIASDFGLHLVRVSERVEARTPALDEVRETVKREWQREALAAANEKYYEGLRARYAVRIEHPRVAAAQ
jgi:parvulin-like peptidyl-prolyl isomerase